MSGIIADESAPSPPSIPMMTEALLDLPRIRSRAMAAGASATVERFEPYRRELTGYCYRMLGSGFEAEDAVQETMVRAWRHADSFEGRASVRSWLYRIATNVCIDMQRQVQRRARPMEMGPSSPPDESQLGPLLPEATWVTPLADSRCGPGSDDPAAIAEYRESVRLAFVAALQHLPARQRAALILCEVLRWQASEVAELLGTSVAAVNSSLQRARATLATLTAEAKPRPLEDADAELLARYVDAFERYDIEALVALLHEDAVQSMPPFAMWVQGARNIGRFMLEPTPSGCRGSKLVPLAINGCPAFAQYKPLPEGGYAPWAIQVLEVSEGRVASLNYFLALLDLAELFPFLGLAPRLDASGNPVHEEAAAVDWTLPSGVTSAAPPPAQAPPQPEPPARGASAP
jgi:RNA polymerase sigma-70 factor (ECF subfamily)